MAFEKLKKQPVAQRQAPLSAPSIPSAPAAQPGVGAQMGMQLGNKLMSGLVSKGTSALLGGGAAAAGGGAAASGLGAAAMTNPVTAPLALGAMAAKTIAGK